MRASFDRYLCFEEVFCLCKESYLLPLGTIISRLYIEIGHNILAQCLLRLKICSLKLIKSFSMQNQSVAADINYTAELTESVEELRDRLEAMKRLMAEQGRGGGSGGSSGSGFDSTSSSSGKSSDSIIDGSFLSVVFAVVLTMILSVSIYAFQNLYYAILKKFPSKHTEL